ncbi:helix-turn-helix domain-containing protein, partial [Gemella cuniculi]
MSYKYLTIKQRNNIEILLEEGYSMRKIAKKIGVNVSTISREIKRCKDGTYTSEE